MIESSDNDPSSSSESDLKSSSLLNDGDNQVEDDSTNSQKWVKFDNRPKDKKESDGSVKENLEEIELNAKRQSQEPAVLDPKIIHVTLEQSLSPEPKSKQTTPIDVVDNNSSYPSSRSSVVLVGQNKTSGPAVIDLPPAHAAMNGFNEINNPEMRTVDLSKTKFRNGFTNADTIVLVNPIITGLSWITPARFRPELVPEELMAQGLTVSFLRPINGSHIIFMLFHLLQLTVEDYVQALETLVNDYRFSLYNICYKRILLCWVIFSFLVLIGILFSGLAGIKLFSLGVTWLFLNAGAIFLCMFVKVNLARDLERCMARVNKQLLRHKILLTLDDHHGNFSCQKVNLCFMYFDASQCIDHLNDFIERSDLDGGGDSTGVNGWKNLDVTMDDIIIQGSNTLRVSRKQVS